jgi:hypothetical protein
MEFFRQELPGCLKEHADRRASIRDNIVKLSDAESPAFEVFKAAIVQSIAKEFTTEQAQEAAPQERIDTEVCTLLIEEGDMIADISKLSAQIDYAKLVQWLIDNKGKTVTYNFADFVSREILEKITGKGLVHRIPIDKTFTATIEGQAKEFLLKGTLSTKSGSINLNPTAGNITSDITILAAKDKIQYNLYYNFSALAETAVALQTNSNDEMEYLFLQQDIIYSAWYKEKVTENFRNEIARAKEGGTYNCNKLDYLYENIPKFVVSSFSDADKWEHLKSLASCRLDATGTNEYEAVLNILDNLQPSFLKTKADQEHAVLMHLFAQFGKAEKVRFMQLVTKKLDTGWIGDEELKVVFPDETLLTKTTTSSLHVVSCFGSEHGLTFGFSYFNKNASGFYTNPEDQLHDKCVRPFTKTGSEPVILRVGDDELVVPAFIAAQIMINRKEESANDLLSMHVGVLLPNALIRPVTLAKWNKFLGKGLAKAELVKRIGVNKFGTTEVAISKIQKIHGVPKKGTPPNLIDDLAKDFMANGYNLEKGPPIEGYAMPDGQVIIIDGHHRLASLEKLGEPSIPIRIHSHIQPEGLRLQLKIGEYSGFYPSSKYPEGFKAPDFGSVINAEIDKQAFDFVRNNF